MSGTGWGWFGEPWRLGRPLLLGGASSAAAAGAGQLLGGGETGTLLFFAAAAAASARWGHLPAAAVPGVVGLWAASAAESGPLAWVMAGAYALATVVVVWAVLPPRQVAPPASPPEDSLPSVAWAGEQLLAAEDPQAVVAEVLDRVRTTLGFDAYWLFRTDEHGRLRLQARTGIPEPAASELSRLGSAVTAAEASAGDTWGSWEREAGFATSLRLPLLAGGHPAGLLAFARKSGRPIETWEADVLSGLAGCLAGALETHRLEEALAEVERRKELFLATLAHELRDPLAPIRNALEALRLGGGPPGAQERSRAVIERQIGQMVHLVDDLLDLARITGGRIGLRLEPIELQHVIERAVGTCRPLVDQKAHTLAVDVPAGLWLHGDSARLEQVFVNLLSNACRFTPGGGRLRLAAAKEGDRVCVVMEDNGVGIDPARLPALFQPFVHGQAAAGLAGGGLGIGLSLVQTLVELHHGTVSAESDGWNRGSRFIVRLPVARPTRPVNTVAKGALEDWMKRRILVVDDNRDSVESMAILLGMLGHEVKTAADGMEAVAVAEDFRPEVVLLDIGMPRMNGYEAAGRIRSLPGGSDMKLIALTGWGEDDDKRSARAAGFDCHVTKPLDPSALRDLLADLPEPRR